MKKIFLLIFVSIFLTSCFWDASKQDLEKAKQDLLSTDFENIFENDKNIFEKSTKTEENIFKIEENWNFIEKRYLTENKFLEIDNFSISDFSDLEQEITWKTLVNVEKIIVKFSNSNSSFPDDSFELKKFKSWDEKFLYRAFKKYETFDYWKNIYVFEAYSGGEVSRLEYVVNLEKPEEKQVEIWELPTSSTFWHPVELWNWKVTYSDVKWLEIENVWEINLENSESSITEFIKSKYKNIFYWNTKRNISGEKWLSFFVVRVENNRYFYEKHYYISGLYWVLSLEEWEFNAEWTIEEKAKILSELNLTLREKNSSFEMEKIANLLFQSL